MLVYYPLEQLSYLCYHGVIPTSFTFPLSKSKKTQITINPDILSIWSCRFWAVYVILDFFHLNEDRILLRQRHASIRKAKGTGLSMEEKEEMAQRSDAFWSDFVINLGYLPLTIHWYAMNLRGRETCLICHRFRSLESGLFKNEVCRLGSEC